MRVSARFWKGTVPFSLRENRDSLPTENARREKPRLAPLFCWLALCCIALPVLAAAKKEADPPGRLILEDPLETLVPKKPRTEADEDRVEALALFATGRIHERRHEFTQALRCYQRAFRFDPEAATVGRSILPLAYALKRHDQAARYALKLPPKQLEDANARILRELGVRLTRQSNWEGAVQMFERAVAARESGEENASDILLHMEMGRLYHLVEEFDEAAKSFTRVIHALDNPDKFGMDEKVEKVLLGEAAATFNLFGECFLRAGRHAEAEAAFRRAEKAESDKGLFNYNMARLQEAKGNPERVLAALEICFKEHLDSEGFAPYELLAKLLEATGRKDELVERLEKLHADDAENLPLAYFLAEQYRKAGNYAKAEPLFRKLFDKKHTITGYRSLAEIYCKTDEPEKLLGVLGKLAADEGRLTILGDRRREIIDNARLVRQLIDIAEKKHEDDPKALDLGVRLAVALLALEAEKFDVADKFFGLAVETEPDELADLFLTYGAALLRHERGAEAAKVFQRAIDEKVLADDNPAFYFYLAGALALDEQTDKALEAARTAAKKRPDSPLFRSRVAWVQYYAKRREDARKAYEKLIDDFDSEYDSRATREIVREARLALSNLAVLDEDMPAAEEWLHQVLDEFPDDVGAQNDLGYLWADQGKRLERSLRMIRRAVEADPENAAYRDSLGWVHYRLENYKEAVAELEKAAEKQSDPIILDHLGDAYDKLGKRKKARESWRRAMKGFRKENKAEEAKEVEKKLKKKKK